jgi:8-oxo-dGTP pyrophosphatase MutT (NUDIX family)
LTTAKRQRVAVLIIDHGQILLLYRYKHGQVYYVIPGGGVEPGESLAQAGLREIKEELGLDIALGAKLWTYLNQDQPEHYFLAAGFDGTVRLGGPELALQSSQNLHRPEWVPLAEVADIPLLPEFIKMKITNDLAKTGGIDAGHR